MAGRPDPRRGQCWVVPLRVQRVHADHQVAGRAGPGQAAAEPGRAQQAEAGQPGHVAQHVQGAAGQVRTGPGGGQRADRHRGQRRRGGHPQERQPPAGHPFRLAEPARGYDGDGGRGSGLEHQRQLQGAVAVPGPDQRDPQPDSTRRYRGHGRRDPPAGGIQPHQAHSRREWLGPPRRAAPFGPRRARPFGRRLHVACPAGGHGSCASVIRPARRAGRYAASQMRRAGGVSAANRWAAA